MADPPKPKMMGGTIRIAVVVDGKVDEIVNHRLGSRDLKRDCERVVDVTKRPDIVVGTVWADRNKGTQYEKGA